LVVTIGTIPGLPKVYLHNPVLAYEVGDEFMSPFHKAARLRLDRTLLDELWRFRRCNGFTSWDQALGALLNVGGKENVS
jgi:hypothetical protein